jgi:hypothetical protein
VSILKDLARKITPSKAVFVIDKIHPDEISFKLNNTATINQKEVDADPVLQLIAKYFSQQYKDGRFIECTDLASVQRSIVDFLCDFYEKFSDLKNPSQSRMRKWMGSLDRNYDHPTSEGFIYLYRYIKNNGDINLCTNHVVTNVFAILDIMRNKYEDAE